MCRTIESISKSLEEHKAQGSGTKGSGELGNGPGHTDATAQSTALNTDSKDVQQSCCVNSDNGKMRCEKTSTIKGGFIPIAIHAEVAGQCDRCSTGVVQDPSSSCTTLTGTNPCL